jgi:hypothetical protein
MSTSTGSFDAIESLVALAERLDAPKLDELYTALAQRISGSGASQIAEAVGELKSMGIDPDKYIAVPRSYTRNKREAARMEQDKLDREQARAHQAKLQDIEIQRLNNGTALQTATVKRSAARHANATS